MKLSGMMIDHKVMRWKKYYITSVHGFFLGKAHLSYEYSLWKPVFIRNSTSLQGIGALKSSEERRE